MFIDFQFSEPWHAENEKLKLALGLPDGVGVRVYPNTFVALFDLGIGTCQFFSHKRSVLIQKGCHPLAGILQGQLLRETYNVQMMSIEALGSADIATTVEGLKKDTVLSILFKNHVITGEQYDLSGLDAALNSKKIYSVTIDHFYKGGIQVPAPFSCFLYPVNENCCIAVIGERFKTPTLFGPQVFSNVKTNFELSLKSQMDLVANQAIIRKIESQLPAGYQSFFKDAQVARMQDRLVIYHPSISADVSIRELQAAGMQAWTPNLCYQQTVDFRSSWWEPQLSSEVQRGLVLVSLDGFDAGKFATALAKAASQAPLRWKF